MAEKKNKKKGCFTWILYLIAIYLIFGSRVISTNSSNNQAPQPSETIAAKVNVITSNTETTIQPNAKPSATPTAEPTEEPLVIYLKYPELGEYGNYYIFNLLVEKATKEDLNTVIQCFVPAGTYKVTNLSRYPTFVYTYSKETHITSAGWEEPVEGWASEMLKPSYSCEVTIEEGHYIKLLDNQHFMLVQKNDK